MTHSRECVNDDYRSSQGASGMTMVMIPQEEWQALNDKLDRLAEMIENRNASDRDTEWLVIALRFRSIAEKESEAARKLLGVSPKTWQNYRDQRVIPFSQIERIIALALLERSGERLLRQPRRPRCLPPLPSD